MSYILEALKRADAERQKGKIPDLQAQKTQAGGSDVRGSRRWQRLAFGLLLGAAVGTAWLVFWPRTAPQPLAAHEASPLAAREAGVEPPGVREPSAGARGDSAGKAAAMVRASREPAAEALLPAPPPPAALRAAAPAAPSSSSTLPAGSQVGRSPTPRQGPAPGIVPVPPRTSSAQAVDQDTVKAAAGSQARGPIPADVPRLADLPATLRQAIPAISMGGYIYTPHPASRSILINNRLAREGEEVAPGLYLEQMRAREAIFNYQGTRYRQAY